MPANTSNRPPKRTTGAPKKGTPVSKKKRRRKKKSRYNKLIAVCVAGAIAIGACGYLGVMGIRAIAGLFKPDTTQTAQASSQSSLSQSSLESSIESSIVHTDAIDTDAIDSLKNMKAAISSGIDTSELNDLKAQIEAYLSEHQIDTSKISWAVQDLTTGTFIESSNAREDFTAASTYKLPLCMYYYEEIAAGRINPNDTLLYSEAMREDEDKENLNQPIHRKFKVGDQIQIDELLEAALLYSDNIAGHMLYENLGGYSKFKQIVTKYSPIEQSPQFTSDRYNVLNADYMMRLLNIIYNTPGTFNDLKYWLQHASLETYLNRSLPAVYIQKIGNINEVRNAGGISNGNAPFSLSIYSSIGKHEGQDVIADLGVLCYNYFNNKFASGYYANEDFARVQMLNAQMSNPVDVIFYRPGPQGQTLPEMTPEEEAAAAEALLAD